MKRYIAKTQVTYEVDNLNGVEPGQAVYIEETPGYSVGTLHYHRVLNLDMNPVAWAWSESINKFYDIDHSVFNEKLDSLLGEDK